MDGQRQIRGGDRGALDESFSLEKGKEREGVTKTGRTLRLTPFGLLKEPFSAHLLELNLSQKDDLWFALDHELIKKSVRKKTCLV